MHTRPALRTLLAPIVIALLAATGTGCGLFDTAAPQPPGTNGGVPANFATPESTLATLTRAVYHRVATDYEQVFADTIEGRMFHATFDPIDVADYQAAGGVVPPDWNQDLEVSFFPYLLGLDPTANLETVFRPDPGRPDQPGGSRTVLQRIYRVYARGVPRLAGSAALTFERVGGAGDWKLVFWEDRIDTVEVELTWGKARLEGR
jgi:hypothetical protein